MNIQLLIYKWKKTRFLSYLDLTDSALKKYEQGLGAWIKEQEAKISTDEEQAGFDALIEGEGDSLELYNDLSFESFIIWLYGYLEKELDDLSNRLRKKLSLNLKLSDIFGKGIKRANIYLRKVCELTLPEEALWRNLIYLAEIRNAIVHNGGIIIDNKRKGELKKFINRHDKKDIFYYPNGKIILKKGYCVEAVDAVFTYLQKIQEMKSNSV